MLSKFASRLFTPSISSKFPRFRHFSVVSKLQKLTIENPEISYVTSNCSVLNAARKMTSSDIDGLLVVSDDNTNSLGIVTESDLSKAIGRFNHFNTIPVSSLMKSVDSINLIYSNDNCYWNNNKLLELTMKDNLRHLIVINSENNKIMELLSVDDIINRILECKAKEEIEEEKDFWLWRKLLLDQSESHLGG